MHTGRQLIYIILLLLPVESIAQFGYKIKLDVAVQQHGKTLKMPWTGGVNAVQINTMDLNGDARPDLVVFDRSVSKIFTFLNQTDHYTYDPFYESLFPAQVMHWMLLRDVNCDGKKDLFTSHSLGLVAFINTTQQGAVLSWRPFNKGKPLLAPFNIQMNASDIPSIDDVDGDGDLDILNFSFVGSSTVQWQKNFSMEREATCDSMQFERVLEPTDKWGNFEECTCGKFAFLGKDCTQPINGMLHHAGGKALLTFDADNDGDKELIVSEENCSNAFLLTNNGTAKKASIVMATPFPADKPISIISFPASFLEDVDFDGLPDLIASPNVYARTVESNPSFHKSVWLYKNTGTKQQPKFTFVKNNFLQDEMIDVGDGAYPAFTDYDGDGDQDMFIGHHSYPDRGGTIVHYENTGTPHRPSFRLLTDNFINLSAPDIVGIKPQFADINSDGNIDLIVVSTRIDVPSRYPRATVLRFIPGKSPHKLDLSDRYIPLVDIMLNYGDNTLVVDVDLDGDKDILIGRRSGALEYWDNLGTPNLLRYALKNPSFMGLGVSPITARSMAVMDLDGDNKEDLVLGDKLGHISIYSDFRNARASSKAITDVIYDPFSQLYTDRNLGGRITPVAVHLFDNALPTLVVGTNAGGVLMLEPYSVADRYNSLVTKLYPNPVHSGESLSLFSTQDTFVELFSITGQKMLHAPIFVTANQMHSITLTPNRFASGIYIARFKSRNLFQSHPFIIF